MRLGRRRRPGARLHEADEDALGRMLREREERLEGVRLDEADEDPLSRMLRERAERRKA